MSQIDSHLQALLNKLLSNDLYTRDNAIAALYEVPPNSFTREILAELDEAYMREADRFLKAGLGRLIKLRKDAIKESEVRRQETPFAGNQRNNIVAKLRGQGPKTFISYAFGNTLAPRIEKKLTEEGFQVTLVADTSLLGEPSLTAALEKRIREAELVIPVLDARANRSNWVRHELKIAKELRQVIIPVVQDQAHLPKMVHDIPYLVEENLDALIPSALTRYAFLKLDAQAPYHLADDSLGDYLRSTTNYIRVIIDNDNFTGRLLNNTSETVTRATEKQPELKDALERQVLKVLQRCIHKMNRAQPLLPHFRSAVENALQRYGPNRVDRSIAAWQRMIRLLVGTELLLISRTLPPSLFPEYWNVAAQSFELEVKNWEIIQGATSQNPSSIWGLKYHGNEASNGWLDVYFHSSSGDDFRGYLPKTEPIYDAVRCRQKPETFFDDYKWADFGLPQLFNTAVTLADRFSDETFPESVVWNLEDYETSSLA